MFVFSHGRAATRPCEHQVASAHPLLNPKSEKMNRVPDNRYFCPPSPLQSPPDHARSRGGCRDLRVRAATPVGGGGSPRQNAVVGVRTPNRRIQRSVALSVRAPATSRLLFTQRNKFPIGQPWRQFIHANGRYHHVLQSAAAMPNASRYAAA